MLNRKIIGLLCLSFSTILAVPDSKAMPSLPKGWRLLVVKREHCKHCSMWVSQVFIKWNKLGLNKVVPLDQIEVIDAENEQDIETLVHYINTKKLKLDISSVPAFVVLNAKRQESSNCRFDGYGSYQRFKDNLLEILKRCTTQ